MIGLPTGACSGLYVVDIDVDEKVNGMSAYRALGLPRAEIAVLTPSGGGHAYFRWPGEGWRNTVGRIAPGIDTRGEGGYVIVPPSAAAAGGYWWVSEPMGERLLAGEVPELPEKLRALLEEAAARERQPGGTPGGRAWAAAALRDEVAGVAAAPPGSRNDRLNRAAFSLGQIVGEGHLDRGRVEGELLAAATAAGLDDREAAATIRSGLEIRTEAAAWTEGRYASARCARRSGVAGAEHQSAGTAGRSATGFPGRRRLRGGLG